MRVASGKAPGRVTIDTQWGRIDVTRGLDALRAAVASVMLDPWLPAVAGAAAAGRPADGRRPGLGWLLSEAAVSPAQQRGRRAAYGDADLAASSEDCEEERTRLIALIEGAR